MNKVILMGRLTRDPMVSYTNGQSTGQQMCVARFTVAVDRRFAKKDANGQSETDFISCVAFGKQGEFVEKYLKKGIKIVLDGRIQTGSYVNKENQKVYTTDVVCDNIEFAESKAASSGSQGGNDGYIQNNVSPTDGFMNITDGVEDEGLPFT